MSTHKISRTDLAAVLIVTVAALIFRAWLQVELRQRGFSSSLAEPLSYLIVPPLIVGLLAALWANHGNFLLAQFRPQDIDLRRASLAISIGILLTAIWWCQLIAGVAFGFYASPDPGAIVGPQVSFGCRSIPATLLAMFVMVVLTPIVEEITHRGFIQTAFRPRGPVVAIVLSTLLFAVLHRTDGLIFVLTGGVVLGAIYWITRSLWMPVLCHATVNFLVEFHNYCTSIHWNPESFRLPLLVPGVSAVVVLVLCVMMIGLAISKTTVEETTTEASDSPR